ncbi:hypothetical protein H0H87_012308, partial [Tephrocybe sp. NHM501043]
NEDKPIQRKKSRFTTKKDRAMIRILAKYDIPRTEIMKRTGFSETTIWNIVNGKHSSQEPWNARRSDWDEVDEEFKKKYPFPTSRKEKLQKHTPSHALVEPSESVHNFDQLLFRVRKRLQDRSKSNHEKSGGSTIHTSVPPAEKTCIDDLKTPRDEAPVDTPRHLPSLLTFLQNLEHDLSALYAPLQEQDLGTSEKLFAFAHWPAESLHDMLKSALPQITVEP